MEKDRNERMRLMEQEMLRHNLGGAGSPLSTEASNVTEEVGRGALQKQGRNELSAARSGRGFGAVASSSSHRSSKRVRSQLITSGKQAERSANRRSVEYCLVSVLFTCTTAHPVYQALREEARWLRLKAPRSAAPMVISAQHSGADSGDAGQHIFQRSSSLSALARNRLYSRFSEGTTRLGESSLMTFVKAWSGRNSGPRDVLCGFLSHVSRYVDHVFTSEVGGVVVLSSCIMECESRYQSQLLFNYTHQKPFHLD